MKILRNLVILSVVGFTAYITVPDLLVKAGAHYTMRVQREIENIKFRHYQNIYKTED